MIPLLIVLLLLFSFFEEKFSSVQKILVFIFCLIFWWFLESFRWESGTDFYNYYNNFNGLAAKDIKTDRFEIGYNLLMVFCRDYLKFTFYIFNSVYYAIIFLLYFFSIRKVVTNPLQFLFVFYCFSIGLMGSTRELMALAIMFFAGVFFLEKQKFIFILLILLAASFHRTIIVCLLFVFFTRNINYKYWLYLIITALILQISGFNKIILEKAIVLLPSTYSERFFAYLSSPTFKDNINFKIFLFGILRRILPIVLVFRYKEKLIGSVTENTLQYITNILFFSLFAYILLSFEFSFIISRISIYFNIFEAVFYAWLIHFFTKDRKYSYVVGLVSFFLVLCIRYIMYYPEIFIPYKTIFFKL